MTDDHDAAQGYLEPDGKILRYIFFDAQGRATQYGVDGRPLESGMVFIPAG